MKNEKFILEIVSQYHKYNFKDKVDAATQAFIEALHQEGIAPKTVQGKSLDLNTTSITFQNPAKSLQNIAVALFKYGISVAETQKESLYSAIMAPILEFKFELEEAERKVFFNAFKVRLSEIKVIINHELLLVEIDRLFDLFFKDMPSIDEYKAKVLIDSKLLEILHKNQYYKSVHPLSMHHPIIIKAYQMCPEMGRDLIHPLNVSYSRSVRIINWHYLLEKSAISPDAIMTGTGYYFAYVIGDVYDNIEPYVTQDLLKNVPLKEKAQLFSLPLKNDRTPLQQLAYNYTKNKSTSTLEAIKKLLENEKISIAHEKNQCWLEILLQQVDTDVDVQQEEPSLLAQIIDAIPKQMCQELLDKGYYKRLKQRLVENLQNKNDNFWLSWSKVKEQNVLFSKAISKIEASAGAQPDAFDESIQSFNEGYPLVLAFLRDSKREESNEFTGAHREYLLIYGIIAGLHESIEKGFNCISDSVIGTFSSSISNGTHSISRRSLEKPVVNPSATLNTAAKLFIEQSFIHWAKDFSPYKNAYKTSEQFATINKNLENRLAACGLDVDAILLSKTSKSILKNMLINLLIFGSFHRGVLDTKIYQIVKQENSELLEKIGLAGTEAVYPTGAYLSPFISTLIQMAKDYRTVYNQMKSNNAINLDCTEYFTKHISKEYEYQPHFIIAIKCILRIIDYRISSFTEGDKYEKGFYVDHLINKKELFLTAEFKKQLKSYKPFFIAQVNLSLRKLELSHYKEKERAKSLGTYLMVLKDEFSINIKDVDENAEVIYAYLGNAETIEKLKNDEVSEQFLCQLNIDYVKHNTISDKDAKKLIDLLIASNQYTQVELYEVNFIAAAVQKQNAYLLGKIQDNKPVMIALWLLFLRKGYMTAVEFKEGHILAFANDQHKDPGKLANLILNNEDFKQLPAGLKQEILVGTYPNSATIQIAHTLGTNSSPMEVLGARCHYGPAGYTANYNMSKFDVRQWVTRSTKDVMLIANKRYSLLMQLAASLLRKPVTEIAVIYQAIADILKILQDMEHFSEKNTFVDWIEVLLALTSPARLKNDLLQHYIKFLTNDIFPLIAKNQKMLEKFFDAGLAKRICDLLQAHTNFYTDNEAQASTYALYFQFLSMLIFVKSRREQITDELFKSVVSQLMYYPDIIPAFELMYLRAVVYSDIQFKVKMIAHVKQMTDKDALVPHTTKIKLLALADLPSVKDSEDAQYTAVNFICSIFKEFITSNIPNDIQQYDATSFVTYIRKHEQRKMTDAQKTAIETSMKKLLTLYCHEHEHMKDNVMINILHFLSLLIDILKLDPQNILPSAFSQYYNDLLWANTYSDKQYPPFFSSIIKEHQVDFLTLSDNAEQMTKRDRFMRRIYQNEQCKDRIKIYYNETGARTIKDNNFIKAIQTSLAYAFKVNDKGSEQDIAFYQDTLFPLLQELNNEGLLELPLFSRKKLFLIMMAELHTLLYCEDIPSDNRTKYKEGEIAQRVMFYVELFGAQALIPTMQNDMAEYLKQINTLKNAAVKTMLTRFNTTKVDTPVPMTNTNVETITYRSLNLNSQSSA